MGNKRRETDKIQLVLFVSKDVLEIELATLSI